MLIWMNLANRCSLGAFGVRCCASEDAGVSVLTQDAAACESVEAVARGERPLRVACEHGQGVGWGLNTGGRGGEKERGSGEILKVAMGAKHGG